MAFGLYSLLEAALLFINAVCILHEERFLAKIGWSTSSQGGFGEDGSVKSQLLNLVRSIRTVMRRDQLSLTCTGPKNSKLLWLCATPDNNWSDQIIIANVSNRFVTRYTIEQPTGMEENQLIKSSVKNGDRGTYTCQDAQGMSSVAVWIVVIDLRTQVIPTPSSNAIVLQCNITGFDTNVPNIAYSWIFKNKTITGSRYSVTLLGGSLSLKISVPGSQDMGQYTCSFGLATTEGIATFQQLISVDDKFINIVSTNSGNFATFLRTLILCAISIIYIV